MKIIKLYKDEIDFILNMIDDYDYYILNDKDKKYRDYKKFFKYRKILLEKIGK